MTTQTTPKTPRIRWGAIVWGLVEAAFATLLLLIASDPALRGSVTGWALSLEPAGIAAVVVAALGSIALLIGLARVLDRR
jgi:hypothetical protein